jgi:hypothetical protein
METIEMVCFLDVRSNESFTRRQPFSLLFVNQSSIIPNKMEVTGRFNQTKTRGRFILGMTNRLTARRIFLCCSKRVIDSIESKNLNLNVSEISPKKIHLSHQDELQYPSIFSRRRFVHSSLIITAVYCEAT